MGTASLGAGLALGLPRRAGEEVKHPSAVRAGPASGYAARELAVVHVHLHHGIQRLSQLAEQGVEGLRLRNVARKAVEDEPGLRVRLAQPLTDHAEHNVVIDEPARIHGRFRFNAKLSAFANRCTQQISRGDLGDTVTVDKTLRLRALAGAGRAQENDTHSFLRDRPYPERLATLPAAP